MLKQNLKGFFTSLIIVLLITLIFFGYKGFLEPYLISKKPENSTTTTLDTFLLNIEEDKEKVVSDEKFAVTPSVDVGVNQATISWETPIKMFGSIEYSNNDKSCETKEGNCTVKIAEEKNKHTFKLENLQPNTEYFYKVTIGSKKYPETGTYSFKTPEKPQKTQPGKDIKEFIEARKRQDLDYDFNKDGIVNFTDQKYFFER